MSDLDLTEAVEAAAEAFALARCPKSHPDYGIALWGSMPIETRHLIRELVLPVVAAAAPFIVAQATNADHERLSNLLHLTLDERNERDETIERVRALLADDIGPHRVVGMELLRAALEPTP